MEFTTPCDGSREAAGKATESLLKMIKTGLDRVGLDGSKRAGDDVIRAVETTQELEYSTHKMRARMRIVSKAERR